MTQPVDPRTVARHGNDIDALYEVTAGIKSTVDEGFRAILRKLDGPTR